MSKDLFNEEWGKLQGKVLDDVREEVDKYRKAGLKIYDVPKVVEEIFSRCEVHPVRLKRNDGQKIHVESEQRDGYCRFLLYFEGDRRLLQHSETTGVRRPYGTIRCDEDVIAFDVPKKGRSEGQIESAMEENIGEIDVFVKASNVSAESLNSLLKTEIEASIERTNHSIDAKIESNEFFGLCG